MLPLQDKKKAGEKLSKEDKQKVKECIYGVKVGLKESCGDIIESLQKCDTKEEAKKIQGDLVKCFFDNKLGERS